MRSGDEEGERRESPAPRLPTVAVVGRQNVGKSTLANRLFGRREAIAHESPGVTRDRVELEAEWRGRRFRVVDTGGFAAKARGVDALVARQAEVATEDADVVLLVVDAQTGEQEEDEALARRLRRARAAVLCSWARAAAVFPSGCCRAPAGRPTSCTNRCNT